MKKPHPDPDQSDTHRNPKDPEPAAPPCTGADDREPSIANQVTDDVDRVLPKMKKPHPDPDQSDTHRKPKDPEPAAPPCTGADDRKPSFANQVTDDVDAMASNIAYLIQNKMAVTEKAGLTIPPYAELVPRPSDDIPFTTTANIMKPTPLPERRCCAMVGPHTHCGLHVYMPLHHPKAKLLCKAHLNQLFNWEQKKKAMSTRLTELLSRKPDHVTHSWVATFMRIAMWTMFTRQHIVVCYFPPFTYGAKFTGGHILAIDFEDKRVRQVLKELLELQEKSDVVGSSEEHRLSLNFGVLDVESVPDDDDDDDDETPTPCSDRPFRQLDYRKKLACLELMQEVDDDIMEKLRQQFRVTVDDNRHRVIELFANMDRIEHSECPMLQQNFAFDDLARWVYLHAGCTGWLHAFIAKAPLLHHVNNPESIKLVLDHFIQKCLNTEVFVNLDNLWFKHGHTVVHYINTAFTPDDGYRGIAEIPSEIQEILRDHPFAITDLAELDVYRCIIHTIHQKSIATRINEGGRENLGELLFPYDSLDSCIMVMLDEDLLPVFTNNLLSIRSCVFGAQCVVLPALAYHLFWRQFALLSPSNVLNAPADENHYADLMRNYLAECLPSASWSLFCCSHGDAPYDTCTVVIQTKRIVILLDCTWNPCCDRDPCHRSQLDVFTSISFSFAATMLRELPNGGFIRGHLISRLLGTMDIETRRYGLPSNSTRYGLSPAGPFYFFNKTSEGIKQAEEVFYGLHSISASDTDKRARPLDVTYYSSGTGVNLATEEPPLMNIRDRKDAHNFDLFSEAAHVMFTREVLGDANTGRLLAEGLWRPTLVTLLNIKVKHKDDKWVPSAIDMHLERKRVELQFGPNDRKKKLQKLLKKAAQGRGRV